MKLKSTLLVAWALIASATVPAQTETPEQKAERMEWFSRAKLGIFIHWGIYSTGRTSESWAFHNKTVPFEEYMDQAKEFTAANYDPAYWAKLIKESGAQYTVITTKHHDGFALWDTKAGDFSVVKSAPAQKDVLAPFCEEIRKQGLKLGFYYSLIDWPREDYPNIFREGPAKYDIHQEPERWQHFVDFNFAQLRELNETWKPDLYWFDGDWEQKAEDWRAKEIVEMLRETTPGVIVNSRIQGYGDYDTPELGVPVTRPASKWWETCMTMNDSWGYRLDDHNYKSPMVLLRMLVDCISLGGNLLLDIGPRADGTIPEEQVAILKEFGRWTAKHKEAIYNTKPGIPGGHVQAYTALSMDGKTLYLYVPYAPTDNIEIKGLKSRIKNVRVVGNGTQLKWVRYNDISWSQVPGVCYIDVPKDVLDERITVIAVDLETPIELYRGAGQVLDFNDYDQ